jgi:hypothetical protein
MRGGASRLPKVPDRRRFGLEEGAIRRMQVKSMSKSTKLLDFLDFDMLQYFESERFIFDHAIPVVGKRSKSA